MSIPAVLAPVFVQVALTFALLVWTGVARVAALRAGAVRTKDIALGQRAWPDRVAQIGNAHNNQYETPVLFYVLVVLAILARKADLLFVAMSWLYVLSRMVHAYVYTTRNVVTLRFQVFAAGAVVLMLMWLIFAVRIVVGP